MKKIIESVLLVLIGIGIGISTGCATLNYLQQGDIKTAIRIATVLYIDNDPEKAEDVLYVVRKTREDIDEYQEITISKAAQFVRANVVWSKLKPLEAIAADTVISRIEAAIDHEIKHAQIPPDKIVLVRSVLDWIEEAIILSQFYIRPSTNNLESIIMTPSQVSNSSNYIAIPTNAIITNNVVMFETTNGLSTIEE